MLTPRKFPLQILKRVPSSFDSKAWLVEIKHGVQRFQDVVVAKMEALVVYFDEAGVC